ncbi:type II toxin-antitoxin system RelE/ParE family toxin [Sphingosinicella sp. YJ22]|uniref:type II toxin-antitoxin system RelE/ParE family toxin n=1 Tax=Sphingosinicella sp. YJ22 TaxID=1104780 RepID=UPI001407E0CF|nr:type II toxin-antitoxin system RelE/ParE family toxin [Sphingosinicella sp. YJ22]
MPDDIDIDAFVLYKGQGFSLEQTDDFVRWLKKLRDREGRLRILKRLRRLSDGHFGDCQPVGEGVHELRMFFGPGYRVYFAQQGETVILLLAGGDKDSQAGDIARAKALAKELGIGDEDEGL